MPAAIKNLILWAKTQFSRYTRYLVAGAMNTLVTYCAFPFFYLLFKDSLNANLIILISCIFTLLFGFVSHRVYTFKSKESRGGELLRFTAVQLILVCLNLALFNLIYELGGFHPIFIQLFLVTVFIFLNYALLVKFVFKH